jgi:hypothetical protein
MIDEVEAHLAEIEATIDMSRLDVDEALGSNGFGEPDEEPHGEAGCLPVKAVEKLPVEIG